LARIEPHAAAGACGAVCGLRTTQGPRVDLPSSSDRHDDSDAAHACARESDLQTFAQEFHKSVDRSSRLPSARTTGKPSQSSQSSHLCLALKKGNDAQCRYPDVRSGKIGRLGGLGGSTTSPHPSHMDRVFRREMKYASGSICHAPILYLAMDGMIGRVGRVFRFVVYKHRGLNHNLLGYFHCIALDVGDTTDNPPNPPNPPNLRIPTKPPG
jgi:hypothetical protein